MIKIRLLPLICLLAILCFHISCTKNNDLQISDPDVLKTGITVEGVITDTSGIPLQNVIVTVGSKQVVTDANGYFRASGANFISKETFVTTSRAGYFNGSRTFFPRENSNNFLRIQLLPKKEVASFNSATGGLVNVDGATINFAPNSIMSASNGLAYNGNVSVKAAYLDPTSAFLNERMPGDLRGIRSDENNYGLRSYGMMVVELEGSAGEKLNLKSNTPAVLTFPIPASLLSTAPQTILLWYFNELTGGLWKEEGVANKVGNNYVGSVSHFTFWNCDIPFEIVQLEMRILDNHIPISNSKVKLTSLVDESVAFGYTDKNGYLKGAVPKNVVLKREVFNECNNVLSTTTIGPFNTNTTLPDLLLAGASQFYVTGTAVNCSNQNVTLGTATILGQGFTYTSIINNGNFSFALPGCRNVSNLSLVVVDESTFRQNSPLNFTITSPATTVNRTQACGDSIPYFISLSINNTTVNWFSPEYKIGGGLDSWSVGGDAIKTGQPGGVSLVLEKLQGTTLPGPVLFKPLSIKNMNTSPFTQYLVLSNIQQPVITNWGAVGLPVTGHFSGIFKRIKGSAVDTVNISGSFRWRRNY